MRFSREAIDKCDELQNTADVVQRSVRNHAAKHTELLRLQVQYVLLQRLNERTNATLMKTLHQLNADEVQRLKNAAREDKRLTEEIGKLQAKIDKLKSGVDERLLALIGGYVQPGDNRRAVIVHLDLVAYSDRSSGIHKSTGASGVSALDGQIQSFVTNALAGLGIARSDAVLSTGGDSAILAFDLPEDAHEFLVRVHMSTMERNKKNNQQIERFLFKSGIATGELDIRPRGGGDYDFSGYPIAVAVRLQSAAEPGEIVIDAETYKDLPENERTLYSEPEMVAGKRTEEFEARRYRPTSIPES